MACRSPFCMASGGASTTPSRTQRPFDDQILSSADPAAQANKTLFQYLTDCTPDEYYKLWGWAYQGNSGQGMQVIEKDSVIVLERFTRDEKVHINKLPPTTLSPDGYELPSMEEFQPVVRCHRLRLDDVQRDPHPQESVERAFYRKAPATAQERTYRWAP